MEFHPFNLVHGLNFNLSQYTPRSKSQKEHKGLHFRTGNLTWCHFIWNIQTQPSTKNNQCWIQNTSHWAQNKLYPLIIHSKFMMVLVESLICLEIFFFKSLYLWQIFKIVVWDSLTSFWNSICNPQNINHINLQALWPI